MKLVVAIIRPERLNEVLEALYRAEVRGLTISRVRGHGGETEAVETYRGMTVKVELHDKVERSSFFPSRRCIEFEPGRRIAPPSRR
jgi:nitrogen regulatory protein PII